MQKNSVTLRPMGGEKMVGRQDGYRDRHVTLHLKSTAVVTASAIPIFLKHTCARWLHFCHVPHRYTFVSLLFIDKDSQEGYENQPINRIDWRSDSPRSHIELVLFLRNCE